MKISFCIPQYNRIQYLLKNLDILSRQTYDNIEVVISDDASTDDTEEQIEKYKLTYRYPLSYYRHSKNVGYDANLRKSMELATGDFCFLLGNDDTIPEKDSIRQLVLFLEANNRPEIGFCNYVEDADHSKIIERAADTRVIGSGEEVALKYYRSFSYVAGLIFRKDVFDKVNTSKADGSVFVQMYFAAKIISSGGRFFTYKAPLVLKDIRIDGSMANSYRDTLMKKWSDFKPIDGGLKQVIWAVTEGFKDAGMKDPSYIVVKDIYRYSYTYWLLDYRSNKSFVGAVAMMSGLKPSGITQLKSLNWWQNLKIRCYYAFSSLLGLFVPVGLFNRFKVRIHKLIKK